MDYRKLEILMNLRNAGEITEEEFQREKAKLQEDGEFSSDLYGMSKSDYLMLLHLSQFASYIIPLLGIVLPFVLWATKREQDPDVDAHGKVVLNWIITSYIYLFVGIMLVFVGIGIPLLILLGVLGLVYPIMGAMKAKNGEFWNYPFSIQIIK